MGRDNNSHGSQARGGGGRGDRSQGRQGHFSRSRFNNNKKNKTTAQIEYKFTPHTTSKTRRATFSTVKDHLVNKIQRDFKGGKDIADSLIAMQNGAVATKPKDKRTQPQMRTSGWACKYLTIISNI
jgi:hypothetical protein